METSLTTTFRKEKSAYTGVELRPHFLLSEFGLKGSALCAFSGPCEVKTEHLVDWEDRINQDHIRARSMLHFLGEFFGISLREGVLIQRMLVSMLADQLNENLSGKSLVRREGDDLIVEERKLTVSIVTASPVSLLLHLGVNVDHEGAPVPAIGLKELGVDEKALGEILLSRFKDEWQDIQWACAKVRPVV